MVSVALWLAAYGNIRQSAHFAARSYRVVAYRVALHALETDKLDFVILASIARGCCNTLFVAAAPRYLFYGVKLQVEIKINHYGVVVRHYNAIV